MEIVEYQKVNSSIRRFSFTIASALLQRKVVVEVIDSYCFSRYEPGLLLVNDGQDLDSLNIPGSMQQLVSEEVTRPFTCVAIKAGERLREYGVSGYPDYLRRGDKANLYEQFVLDELLPAVHSKTLKSYKRVNTFFAGCSLGGLSALDIAISNHHIFGGTGVFSGSLWWRKKSYVDGYTENDRIIFTKIRTLQFVLPFRTWLMAGTNDEHNDRNQNGVIDSVDDTMDMFDLLASKNFSHCHHLQLCIARGGSHNQSTWSQYFPDFLKFAFGIT